ncbi:MAG: PAS domain S-box protein [Chloroflexota bacterium]|nr:PAS domain S-box protein [Chloroflexota bacterium]
MESSNIGTWMIDIASGKGVWDSRTKEIFGVDPDEPLTMELFSSLIHPEDHGNNKQAYDQAVAQQSNGIYAADVRIVHPDGQVRWISTRGNAIFEGKNAERKAVRLVGIAEDVTAMKQCEIDLGESRIKYQILVETMKDGMGVIGKNNIFAYVNPRLAEMLGYSQDDMIGEPPSKFFDSKNKTVVADQLARREKDQKQPYPLTWLRRDGTELHTLVTAAAVFTENNDFLCRIAVVTDISEQIKNNQLLDKRMMERMREITTLMEVSKVVVSSLKLEEQLKIILKILKQVIEYDGALVMLFKEKVLISEAFQFPIEQEMVLKLAKPFTHMELIDKKFKFDEAIFFPDVRDLDLDKDTLDFFNLTTSMLGSFPPEIRSWIGVPIKSRNTLIGVLGAHSAQVAFFTPEMAKLMRAFANQIAIVFENNRLYNQAQTAAAASERIHLARELHDSVSQDLYSIRLFADASRSALLAGSFKAVEKNLDELIVIARAGMDNLRLLIFDLRPPVLDELGLSDALRKRLETVEQRCGILVEFQVEGKPKFSRDMETQLYWAIYEALNNVLKHAKAKNVELRLCFHENLTTVTLKDDGVGFDLLMHEHSELSGLNNIAHRVESLGGTIKIQSSPGEGTVIQVSIP